MPRSAYRENWLYDLIDQTLETEFDRVDASLPPQGFRQLIPSTRLAELERKGELRAAIDGVVAAYGGLGSTERHTIRQAQREQRNILALFNGAGEAKVKSDLPPSITNELGLLADRAFEALDALQIRDRSYQVHARSNALLCAFCGYEAWDQPSERTMDWDHYLARSLYPFAAMNLRNLAPMGTDCNRYFKKSKDVLRSNGGMRRVCFDPYASTLPRIDLLQSELFAAEGGTTRWVISYHGDSDRCASWNSIFELDTRWKGRLERVSDVCFAEIAGHFDKSSTPSLADIIERLRGCRRRFGNARRHDFLEGAVFDLWLNTLTAPSPAARKLLRRILRRVAKPER